MKKSILFFLFGAFLLSCLMVKAMPLAPDASGIWMIDLTLDSRPHQIQFNAQGDHTGTLLLLDNQSSLNPPPTPQKATWMSFDDGRMEVSGHMEFPIGNVGVDSGTLVLTGTFSGLNSFIGTANFVNDSGTQPPKTGNFSAVRTTDAPSAQTSVKLMSTNDGEALRRGSDVSITWNVITSANLSSQQLFLSVDKGRTFTPISGQLDGSSRTYLWHIPEDMPKVKKALLQIIIVDEKGTTVVDVSDSIFKIK